jgi:serine protease Do
MKVRMTIRTFALAALLAVPALGQPAPQASAEDIAFANRLAKVFKSVASQAEPSVVHIVALARRQQVRRDWFGMPIEVGPASLVPVSQGSGFVFDSNGTIITNNHVIAQAEQVRVKFPDGREADAKLVGKDEATDLAVLRITAGGTGYVPITLGDSDALDVGEWVVAIGSPFGFSRTVTAGIVSAKGRSLTPRETGRTYEDFLQTDAAINPGNSGGPLLNLQGQVVGINSAIASRTGGYEGLGFAIPSNVARAVVDNILANGRVVRGYLGVGLSDTTPEKLNGFNPGNDVYRGAVVGTVEDDSPAARAGLQEGDVILRYQGQPVNEARLRTAIAVTRPGTRAEIEVLREGRREKVVANIGDYAAVLAERASTLGEVYIEELGASVRTFTRQMAREAGYRDARVRGVQVIEVADNSPAARSGLQAGDIIVQAGDESLSGAKGLVQLVTEGRLGGGTRLGVVRGNRMGTLVLQR